MKGVDRMDNSDPTKEKGLTMSEVQKVITKPGWEKKTPQVVAEPEFSDAVASLMEGDEGSDSGGGGERPKVPESPSPQELVRKILL